MGSSDDQKKFGIVWQNQILHVLEKVPSENMRGIWFFQTIPKGEGEGEGEGEGKGESEGEGEGECVGEG